LPDAFKEGAAMSRSLFLGAVFLIGVSIFLTVGAASIAAQGPAGAGAAAAAQDSSHSFNPIKWVKKDSDNSATADANRDNLGKKLTPVLQSKGVLAANVSVTDACAPFTTLYGCLAALHASHNLGVDFYCLRADMTGVDTSADVSGCRLSDGDKALGLSKALHQLKPSANVKQAAKDAEQQAKDDLQLVGA
jgi:hypothetical protein